MLERRQEEYPLQMTVAGAGRLSYSRRIALSAALLCGVLTLGATSSSAFIYFQF